MITNNFNKELRGISDALRDLGYTDSTIGLRQRYWKEYCFFHGSLDIDEASMDEFLLKNYDIQSGNINVSKRQYEVRAALRNLLEYRRYGKIRNYHTPWFKDLPWVESFRAITEDFISHLRSQNSKPETIVNYERTLKRITNHLHSVGVDSFRDMTPEHISSFLSTSIPDLVRNLRATLCHLRVFFRYLYLNEFTKDDLSLFIPKSNVLLKRKHIPSTWTREDIDKILACIDLASPVGKRDYAIILLVARLGIRVSDVIRLEFDNIKWEKNCIQISQYKTNEPLVLPLFEDVGQAIIDYVKNGRPASDLKLVFITHKPPFQKFSDNNHLYGMFNKYLYTIKSYRDTFCLLLLFMKEMNKKIDRICLVDIDADLVIRFLDWLEVNRGNSASTRNVRLAAIHAFFRYVQFQNPEMLLHCQRILAIPMKETEKRFVEYLPEQALRELLSLPDQTKKYGIRDTALLCLLYDSGARVQELIDLSLLDIRLETPATIRLYGKGRKVRVVPLMSQTATILQKYLNMWHLDAARKPDDPVFVNHQGKRLTRPGVTYCTGTTYLRKTG